MALEVPTRETTGDCGLRGSGGGALSGSELSHLFLISERQRADIKGGNDNPASCCWYHDTTGRVGGGGQEATGEVILLTWGSGRGRGRRRRNVNV